MNDETPWGHDGPPTDVERNYAAQMAHTGRNTPTTTKRKGATPEAKVSAACDVYLKLIGALCIRANAGSWQDEQGNYIMGAKAGTADKIVCLNGRFIALEIKSATGTQSDAQKRFQARVVSLGGIYILAHSKDELRAALVTVFGEQAIKDRETLGAARRRR